MILRDDTFEEKASFTSTVANLAAGCAAITILIIMITTILIASTPLREYLIFNGDGVSRRELSKAYAKSDSLEVLVQANKIYLTNLQNVMSGKPIEDIPQNNITASQRRASLKDDTERSAAEMALRTLVELESRNAGPVERNKAENPLPSSKAGRFVNPVKGMVSNGFSSKDGHYAVDIAAKKSETIKASLGGRVIFSEFTAQTGYVIALQHANNMVTFYKHCSTLLKKTGSFVRAGEVIAIVGNTGEYTSGPHLHFELWQNGNAVDPEKYINF